MVKQAGVLDLMVGPVQGQGGEVMLNSADGVIHGNVEMLMICVVVDGRAPLM